MVKYGIYFGGPTNKLVTACGGMRKREVPWFFNLNNSMDSGAIHWHGKYQGELSLEFVFCPIWNLRNIYYAQEEISSRKWNIWVWNWREARRRDFIQHVYAIDYFVPHPFQVHETCGPLHQYNRPRRPKNWDHLCQDDCVICSGKLPREDKTISQ